MPNLPDNGAFCKINQCSLLPPFSSCIITKIAIMKILSASQPPSPHFSFPPFCPPAHCLAHSLWRKFIKMKLRLQLSGFIKIHLPLTDPELLSICSGRQKKDLLNNFETFISTMLWTHMNVLLVRRYTCWLTSAVKSDTPANRHFWRNTVWCYSL